MKNVITCYFQILYKFMKWSIILLSTLFMFTGILLAHSGYGQDPLAQKISIESKNQSLVILLEELQTKSELNFIYQPQMLQDYEVTIKKHKVALAKVLDEVLKDKPFRYEVRGNNVVIIEIAKSGTRLAHNQSFIVVSGKVTDKVSGEPLPGVNISIKTTTQGTNTGIDGRYRIEVPDNTSYLIFSYVGYESQEIRVGSRSVIDMALEPGTASLSEVVITALGVEREEKSLGYAVQELNGKRITDAYSSNWTNTLNGKVAGLYMTKSTSMASSSRIVLRGENSLNLDKNQALIVIDGVPVTNVFSASIDKGQYSSEPDFGNGLSEINPDDIESITVLKGPSAAALYGSRAANGVIMIKTKSATGKQGIGVSINSNIQFESVNRWPDYQYAYGAGGVGKNEYYSYGSSEDGPSTANSGYNWGPKFEGQEYVQFGSPVDENGDRTRIPWEPHKHNIKDFFETGHTITNNVALSGGNDIGNFRLSYTNMQKSGIMPNNQLERNTFSLNAGMNLTDKLRVNAVANYIAGQSDNLTYNGYNEAQGIMYYFIWMERNADLAWLRDYWVEGKEGREHKTLFTWSSNPYFVVNEVLNGFRRDRLYGNINATYSFTDRLSIMLRAGTDFFNEGRDFRAPWSTVGHPFGYFRSQKIYSNETNIDFLLKYDYPINNDWHVSFSLGGNQFKRLYDMQDATAEQLALPDVYSLANSRSRPLTDAFESEKRVNSLYGSAQFAYKNMIFLDVTGRNDWSSTLPAANNSYFYPSFNLSGVLTDIFDISGSGPLSFAKLRLSWAQVGNDTDPFQLEKYYEKGDLDGSLSNPSQIPNPNLKPEITTSYEVGTNLKFFDGRLDIDFTYYYTESKNQILSVPLDISTGFSSKVLNAGLITNEGIEISLSGIPVKLANGLNWQIYGNWSTNKGIIKELGEGIESFLIASSPGSNVEARVGEEFGNIYGRVFERAPDGQIVYENGVAKWTSDFHLAGNYNPDWVAGIGNELSYKNFSFSFLFDGRKGGDIYSLTHATMAASGGLTKTLPYRYEGVVGEGVMLNDDGNYVPNNVRIDAPTYWRGIYRRFNAETNTIDASFIKLREVRIAYNLPAHWLKKALIQRATIALVGRDLFVWSDWPIFDPEASVIDGGTITPGIERGQFPSTRTYGVNISFNF